MIARRLLILFMLAVIAPTLFYRTGRSDLHILDLAAHRLMKGEVVYRLEDPNEHTKPPLATLAFIPFSKLPLFWLFRLWDFFNLAAIFVLLRLLVSRFENLRGRRLDWTLFALFVVLTPFNSELRLGQYNVLLLLFLLGSVFKERAFLSGVAACLAFLFKPTFVLLFPWVFVHLKKKGWGAVGFLCTLGVLSAFYTGVFGAQALLSDWRVWSEFLELSSAKHLLRWDNHGLPSAIAAATGISTQKILGILGLLVCAWSAYFWRDGFKSLAVACVCMVVLSPMAWLQNYVLLLPALFWVASEYVASGTDHRRIYGLAVLVLWFGIGALNPTTSQWLQADKWPIQRIPLWVLLLSVTIVVFGQLRKSACTQKSNPVG